MSSLKLNALQIGDSATANQNITIQPSDASDGTMQIAIGTPDTTVTNVLSVAADDTVTIPQLQSYYYTDPQSLTQVATQGSLDSALTWDAAGNLYWAVSNHFNGTVWSLTSYVYKITPQGAISVFASAASIGASGAALAWDTAGNLYWSFGNKVNGNIYNLTSYVYRITPAGAMTTWGSVATNGITKVALTFDAAGNLYWGVSNGSNGVTYNLTSYVYKITPAGAMTTWASVATNSSNSCDLTWDAAGNLYWAVTNYYNDTIYNLTSYVYRITPAGTMTTWASVATNAAVRSSLTWDTSGNLYWAVANHYNGTTYNLNSYVYKITPAGAMTTWASVATQGADSSSMIWDSSGNLYWSIANNATLIPTCVLYRITPAGQLSTISTITTDTFQKLSKLVKAPNGDLYLSIISYYNTVSFLSNSYIYRLSKQLIIQ